MQTVRNALGNNRFSAACERGRKMSVSAARAYALREQHTGTTTDTAGLTKRERQVAELVAQGLTNKKIAGTLVISPRTAQGHVEKILAKLGFTSRARIAAWIADDVNGG